MNCQPAPASALSGHEPLNSRWADNLHAWPTSAAEGHEVQSRARAPRWAENLQALARYLPAAEATKASSITWAASIFHLLAQDGQGTPHALSLVESNCVSGQGMAFEHMYRADGANGELLRIGVYPLMEVWSLPGSMQLGPRPGFTEALGSLHDTLLQSFSAGGIRAYVVSAQGLTFGVVSPSQGGALPRIMASPRFWKRLQETILHTEIWGALLGDDADEVGSMLEQHAWELEPEDDSTLGLAPMLDSRFAPEMLIHSMPGQVRISLEQLASKLARQPGTWEGMSAHQRSRLNQMRIRHISLPVVTSRYDTSSQGGAYACLADLIGTAGRITGDDLQSVGGIGGMLEMLLEVLEPPDSGLSSTQRHQLEQATRTITAFVHSRDGLASTDQEKASETFLRRVGGVALHEGSMPASWGGLNNGIL